MRRDVAAAVVLALLAVGAGARGAVTTTPPIAADGVCSCAEDRAFMGWCPVHRVGSIGGLTVTSRWLFDTLDAHGHDVDTTTFTCPSCRRAIATDGFCDEHRTGFVGKRAYFSWLTYALAHGERKRPSEIACAVCRKNSASHGWCDKHRIGMVASVAIARRDDYDRTIHALSIVEIANEAAKRCEHCAAAIVTDTTCPVCRIQYRDGHAVTGAAGAGGRP